MGDHQALTRSTGSASLKCDCTTHVDLGKCGAVCGHHQCDLKGKELVSSMWFQIDRNLLELARKQGR
jgi:hypothetical protein